MKNKNLCSALPVQNIGTGELIFLELTANYDTAKFIGRYGCEEYYKYNKELLFYERQQEILAELDELCLD